jgi:hypothetical protein
MTFKIVLSILLIAVFCNILEVSARSRHREHNTEGQQETDIDHNMDVRSQRKHFHRGRPSRVGVQHTTEGISNHHEDETNSEMKRNIFLHTTVNSLKEHRDSHSQRRRHHHRRHHGYHKPESHSHIRSEKSSMVEMRSKKTQENMHDDLGNESANLSPRLNFK